MTEPLPEQQKIQMVIRSPLSEDGVVSIYFSSPDGRLMTEVEWQNLKQVVEMASKFCAKYEQKAQTARAGG